VQSLERAVCSGRFLSDASIEKEFERALHQSLEHGINFNHQSLEHGINFNQHGIFFGYTLRWWSRFFYFMHDDAGGIMSHINTLMEQEHGPLLHDWKHVEGDADSSEQLIGNLQRFRILCKDFRIQDREYDCLTSNFLVEKPRGLRMHEHPFFMTERIMTKLRFCRANYSVIELRDKYELLENFLLHDGGHFEDTFKLRSTVVQVKSIKNPPMFLGKTVNIEVESEIWGYSTRVVSYKSPHFHSIAEIKLMGRVLSCLKHMSNYKDDEAQFGVIDNLYKVGCDNFIVAKSPTIHEILHMQPPNNVVLVDLGELSDVPLIFGGDFTDIDASIDTNY
jgi:hypothetical protein